MEACRQAGNAPLPGQIRHRPLSFQVPDISRIDLSHLVGHAATAGDLGQAEEGQAAAHAAGGGERGGPAQLYELYAVCNHVGSLSGGHYTAMARCASDGRWCERKLLW